MKPRLFFIVVFLAVAGLLAGALTRGSPLTGSVPAAPTTTVLTVPLTATRLLPPTPSPAAPTATVTPGATAIVQRVLAPAFYLHSLAPRPSVTPSRSVTFVGAWRVDSRDGWLIGQSCPNQIPPTPHANANIPSDVPPGCTGLLRHTTDGGQTWSESAIDLIPRAIQFVDASQGWIMAQTKDDCNRAHCDGVILRTSDGGRTWKRSTLLLVPALSMGANQGASVQLRDLRFTSPMEGWVFGQVCRSETNPGCAPILMLTHDGGAAWTIATLPAGLNGQLAFSVAHPSARVGWIVGSGGLSPSGVGESVIEATTDGGQQWRERASPLPPAMSFFTSIAFRDPRTGWLIGGGEPGAGNEFKAIYTTRDAGQTWSLVASTGTLGLTPTPAVGIVPMDGYVGASPEFVSPTEAWLLLKRVGLMHTKDGGKTWWWTQVGQDDALQSVSFVNPRDGWVVEGWHLFATTDGGATWKVIAASAPLG